MRRSAPVDDQPKSGRTFAVRPLSGLLVSNLIARDESKLVIRVHGRPVNSLAPAAVRSSRPPRPPPSLAGPLAAALPARAAAEGPAFLHGVASGDPLPDGVLLWTRVTPTPEAMPGSGLGPDTEVSWEVAEDKALHQGRRPGLDHRDGRRRPHRQGRRPRARARPPTTGSASRRRRRRTPPSAAPAPRPPRTPPSPGLRFGVVSCANWEAGYFSAYRHLAARGDLDAVLHLGDYIYEYGTGEYRDPRARRTPALPARTRSSRSPTTASGTAATRRTPTSRRCTPRTPSSRSGTTTSSPTTPGRAAPRTTPRARRAPGPARQSRPRSRPTSSGCRSAPSTEGTTYRRLRFGKLADLHLLDLRSFRSAAGVRRQRRRSTTRTVRSPAGPSWTG